MEFQTQIGSEGHGRWGGTWDQRELVGVLISLHEVIA